MPPVAPPQLLQEPAYDEERAKLFARFTQVTFCDKGAVLNWSCGPACEAAPVVRDEVVFLGSEGFFGVVDYVAKAAGAAAEGAADHCVVGFRGTSNFSPENWAADVSGWMVAWPPEGADWCAGCEVIFGFSASYEELRAEMLAALKRLECRSTTVVGHSLGAAVADLASVDLRAGNSMNVTEVWTYGKPRVGNTAFVDACDHAAVSMGVWPPMWRLVHYHDIIPHLPPHKSYGDVQHGGREVWYTTENSTIYEVCDLTAEHDEDPNCSLSHSCVDALFGCTMADHTLYLNLTFEEADFPTQCISSSSLYDKWFTVIVEVGLALASVVLLLCACVFIARTAGGGLIHRRRRRTVTQTLHEGVISAADGGGTVTMEFRGVPVCEEPA
eukprot:NODE_8016_length_1530_cov_5.129722.p1 GENE.NODE_8016_length_1530_cov_5.129722~~NODE_8016_length_1530_cov_5.129722.p1  ORF type:complete len:385 (+),score=100.16 NODE_8016_length_1530_cov_5.129722:154-1308(+)